MGNCRVLESVQHKKHPSEQGTGGLRKHFSTTRHVNRMIQIRAAEAKQFIVILKKSGSNVEG